MSISFIDIPCLERWVSHLFLGRTSMNAKLLLIPLLLVMVSGSAAVEGDLARIQGRWGTTVGPRKDADVLLEIKGNAVSATIQTAKGMRILADGEIRIDERMRPKALDWVKFTTVDGHEVPLILAIYRIEGDRLIIRSGGFNDRRPTAFEGGEGIWSEVLVFERR